MIFQFVFLIISREHLAKNVDQWTEYYNSPEPQSEELPAPWHMNLNHFQRMMVLRVIRPDKVGVTCPLAHEPEPFPENDGVTCDQTW